MDGLANYCRRYAPAPAGGAAIFTILCELCGFGIRSKPPGAALGAGKPAVSRMSAPEEFRTMVRFFPEDPIAHQDLGLSLSVASDELVASPQFRAAAGLAQGDHDAPVTEPSLTETKHSQELRAAAKRMTALRGERGAAAIRRASEFGE